MVQPCLYADELALPACLDFTVAGRGRRLALLRVTGRRTGRRYEITVGYDQQDGQLAVLVSDASNRTWWRNFVDGGPIEVVLWGRPYQAWATAHRPPSPEFKRPADRALLRLVGRDGTRRFFGIADFDRSTGLTEAQMQRLEDFVVAVGIDFDQREGRDSVATHGLREGCMTSEIDCAVAPARPEPGPRGDLGSSVDIRSRP